MLQARGFECLGDACLVSQQQEVQQKNLTLGSPPRCCQNSGIMLRRRRSPSAPTPPPALPQTEPPHTYTYPTRAPPPAQPSLIKMWQLGQRLYLHPCPGSCAVAEGEGGLQGGLGHAQEQARYRLPLGQLPETISWCSSSCPQPERGGHWRFRGARASHASEVWRHLAGCAPPWGERTRAEPAPRGRWLGRASSVVAPRDRGLRSRASGFMSKIGTRLGRGGGGGNCSK